MNAFSALTAGGALLLITALPAAGQPVSLHAPGAPTQFASEEPFFAKKDAYMQRSKDEMRDWQKKLHDFGAKGRDGGAAGLRKAWSKAELESHKLDAARAEGWESARRSFEEAAQNLKDAWHDAHRKGE